MKSIPPDSIDLIRQLDEQFPPKCIGKRQTPDEAHRYAGRRDLIDELLNRLAAAEKKQLKETLNV